MAMNGSLFKRCACTRPETGPDGSTKSVRIGQDCPKLKNPDGTWNSKHGTWAFQLAVPVPAGAERIHLRRSGFPTLAKAQAKLGKVTALLELADGADQPDTARREIADLIRPALKTGAELPRPAEVKKKLDLGQPLNEHVTIGAFLRTWVQGKKDLKTTTRTEYRRQINQYLIPLLGADRRLDRLRAHHAQAAFDAIAEQSALHADQNAQRKAVIAETKAAWREHRSADARAARALLKTLPSIQPTPGPATIQRIRACLRSALTDAAKQELITVNVAKLVNLPSGRRPKPRVWTETRVQTWRETGQIPYPVMVWTTEQTNQFLHAAKPHPLYPLYALIIYTGLRRGEACALRWADIDFTTGRVEITQQLIQDGWDVLLETTKSEAGERAVIGPRVVLKALAKHQVRQNQAKTTAQAAGEPWTNTGLVFTRPDGTPIHPQTATDEFRRISADAKLPPIRLHDLRHGTATQALAAGVDLKVVSEILGHSSITITADTYSSVLDELKRDAADKIAARLALEDEDEDHDTGGTNTCAA